MKRKKIDNFKLNPIAVISFLITIFVVSVSIGFSALSSNISIGDISALIRVKKDIRVTGFALNTVSGSAVSEDEDFNVDYIKSSITLPNQSSSVTYDVFVTNIESTQMGILEITGLPSNLKYTTTGYQVPNKLCDSTNFSQCNLGSVTKFQIKIEYDNNGFNASNTSYDLGLSLNFKQAFDITYIGFNSTTDLPNVILEQETKNIVFNSTHGIPSSVMVSGAVGNLNTTTNTLTLTGAIGNVTITNNSSSGDGTLNNPYIISDNNYNIVNLDSGYTKFTSVDGEPIIYAETNQGVTTIKSFSYTTIDNDGVSFGTGSNDNTPLDTGIMALDGNPMSIHIRFKSNLSQNQDKFIITALQQTGTNTYSGFSLSGATGSVSYLRMSTHINKTYSDDTLYATSTQNLNKKNAAQTDGAKETEYEVTIVYDPSSSQQLQATYNGSTLKITRNNTPQNLNNAKVTIGGNGINNKDDMVSLKILDLQICKGTFGANYTCNYN